MMGLPGVLPQTRFRARLSSRTAWGAKWWRQYLMSRRSLIQVWGASGPDASVGAFCPPELGTWGQQGTLGFLKERLWQMVT